MKFCYLQFTVLMLLLCGVVGHRNGAPKEACKSMFPSGHGVTAQKSRPPYTRSACGMTFFVDRKYNQRANFYTLVWAATR